MPNSSTEAPRFTIEEMHRAFAEAGALVATEIARIPEAFREDSRLHKRALVLTARALERFADRLYAVKIDIMAREHDGPSSR